MWISMGLLAKGESLSSYSFGVIFGVMIDRFLMYKQRRASQRACSCQKVCRRTQGRKTPTKQSPSRAQQEGGGG